MQQGNHKIPSNPDGVGGISLGKLDRLMRQRWQTISRLWEANKAKATRLSLIEQLDYMGKLSSQLEWQNSPADSRMRVVYTKSGEPTAAVITDDRALIDHLLYWIPCKDGDEANYLLWTLRILSGVSEGICNTLVQSGGEFLYIGVGGR